QHLARAEDKQLLKAWNVSFADRAAEELVRQLVLAVRIWRPDVVIADHPDGHASGWPCETLIADALHAAFTLAADPRAFPEQLKLLGLEPWQPNKSYARCDSAATAQVKIDLTEVSDRLEASIRDFAAPAQALLADTPTTLPSTRYFHLLESRLPGAEKHVDLMGGIELTPAGVSRRAQPPITALAPEIEKSLRTRRNLQNMAEAPANELTDPKRLLTQIGPMLSAMTKDHAA